MSITAKLIVWAFLTIFATTAHAEWDGVKTANSTWYEAQQINPEAQARLGVSWKSCCNHRDVVKTRFRVSRETAEDEWFYLDGNTWRKISPDIVHWNDPTQTASRCCLPTEACPPVSIRATRAADMLTREQFHRRRQLASIKREEKKRNDHFASDLQKRSSRVRRVLQRGERRLAV